MGFGGLTLLLVALAIAILSVITNSSLFGDAVYTVTFIVFLFPGTCAGIASLMERRDAYERAGSIALKRSPDLLDPGR
jgi:ABC-type Fe3+ transport system permease subunit